MQHDGTMFQTRVVCKRCGQEIQGRPKVELCVGAPSTPEQEQAAATARAHKWHCARGCGHYHREPMCTDLPGWSEQAVHRRLVRDVTEPPEREVSGRVVPAGYRLESDDELRSRVGSIEAIR